MAHMAAARAWDTWRERAAKQRRLTRVASKGVRRLLGRTQALALGRWRENTAKLRRQRNVRDAISDISRPCFE
jgi:hypothetical protein